MFFPVPWFMDGAGHSLDGAFASIAALYVNQISRQRQFGSSPMVSCPRKPTANVRKVTRICLSFRPATYWGHSSCRGNRQSRQDAPPVIAYTTNGAFSYRDATVGIARSVRTYKGKILLLVSAQSSSLRVGSFYQSMWVRCRANFNLARRSPGQTATSKATVF